MSDIFTTIKTPSGVLVRWACSDNKTDAVEDFIYRLIRDKVMLDRKDWYGPAYTWRYWLMMRRAGYTTATVRVSIDRDEEWGWQVPVLSEVSSK